MKEKRSINKILEGRCRGIGADYVGMKKANESHSRGASAELFDPITGRTVDVLSNGERYFFWKMRFDEHVVEIREQQALHPDLVARAAAKLHVPIPADILSTDLVVLYDDGRIVAYSVKYSRKEITPDTVKGRKVIRRQALEQLHWKMLGVEFRIRFTDEMDRVRAENIESVMVYYDPVWVQTPDQMYKYLIAHHVVEVELSRPVAFVKIARDNEAAIRKLFFQKTGIHPQDMGISYEGGTLCLSSDQ